MAAATPTIQEEPSVTSIIGAAKSPVPNQQQPLPPGVLKRQHSAIPEGDEDADEEDDMPFPEDEEAAVRERERACLRFFVVCICVFVQG